MNHPMTTLYHIKPLAWTLARSDPAYGEWWTASTVFGSIDVEWDSGLRSFVWRYCFDECYDEGRHDCESVEEGKRRAEEFYLGRLLPALELAGEAAA